MLLVCFAGIIKVMKSIKIGNVTLKNNAVLAPLAGFSDMALRYLSSYYGAGLTCTEMVSAKSLEYHNKKAEELLCQYGDVHPRAVQIFGHEPAAMAAACKNPLLKDFDIIDINMGCPTPKIVKNGDGSALLGNPKLAAEIIKACVEAAGGRPVTVKMRIGIDGSHICGVEFAKMCQDAGASAITVHGRTAAQGYSGKSNLMAIKEIVQSVSIPVFANGDCTGKASFDHILAYTGAAGVAIGRAAIGAPEIFAEITNKKFKINKLDQIEQHIKILRQFYPDKQVLLTMRGTACHYLKTLPNTAALKTSICKSQTLAELLDLLKEFFNNKR